MPNWSRHLVQYLAILTATIFVVGPVQAQTKLKWAHVYEVAEPYHSNALWAADEIKKRTDGRYEIGVFPASQLGNENQINEGLGLGTVDIIYTGASFAGSIHKPLAITGAPFILRDFDHWKAYRDSQLFRDLAKGYEDKTRHKVVAILYYGQRMLTANREIKKPEDMKGMKLRVPPAPLFLMFTKSVGANATPIAFAEVYLALQQGTVDGQENPYNTIDFDWDLQREIEARVQAHGTDGRLVQAPSGGVLHVTLSEKLLTLLLAKLVNFVPEGGIWMNTQRPEWNDANNALVAHFGSRRKRDIIYQKMKEEGVTAEAIARVYSPIGVPIGGETPEEIAVSIAAEMIKVRAERRGAAKTPSPLAETIRQHQ